MLEQCLDEILAAVNVEVRPALLLELLKLLFLPSTRSYCLPICSIITSSAISRDFLSRSSKLVARLAEPLSGGAVPPDLPTFAEGLEVARLLEAARRASKERRRVHLEEVA